MPFVITHLRDKAYLKAYKFYNVRVFHCDGQVLGFPLSVQYMHQELKLTYTRTSLNVSGSSRDVRTRGCAGKGLHCTVLHIWVCALQRFFEII